MSDENGEVLFNPQGSSDEAGTSSEAPETPSQPEDDGQEAQPKFVTEDILNERLSEIERKVQSSRDSALSTFDKRIKQKIEQVEKDIDSWRKQGVKITPEQEQQRRLNALQEAMLENPDAESPSPQPAQATPGQDVEKIRNEVNAWAAQYMERAGVQFDNNDPELLLLDHSSPQDYMRSLRSAVYQKRMRVGEVQAPSPQSRIPSMAKGSAKLTTKEQQFLDEYRAAQGQGLPKAREIRQKWAKEGVDVASVAARLS